MTPIPPASEAAATSSCLFVSAMTAPFQRALGMLSSVLLDDRGLMLAESCNPGHRRSTSAQEAGRETSTAPHPRIASAAGGAGRSRRSGVPALPGPLQLRLRRPPGLPGTLPPPPQKAALAETDP